MITEREKFNVAQLTVQLLEQRVNQISFERRSKLSSIINLDSKNQLFWYGSDENGYIPVLQDAAFVCTGVHVIGQQLTGITFWISIENLWVPRQATQSYSIPTHLDDATDLSVQQSISVPVDHFMPAHRLGQRGGTYQVNVDYWYTPSAAWVIERGDTVRCLFKDDKTAEESLKPPLVVLSGYKVMG